jgi:hypothetical protein
MVKHIQRLGAEGCTPNEETDKELAYQFAQTLALSSALPYRQEMAGYGWLASVLERNPEVSDRRRRYRWKQHKE